MRAATVTVAFSTHRPETIPLTAASAAPYAAIVLEEPPDPRLAEMLAGRLDIETYLLPLDLEYPEYSRAMCLLLRDLHRQGKRIFQVEPFVEALIEIHERFAAGAPPASVVADPRLAPVYSAEKKATGALLEFYEASGRGDFGETLAAVKSFARADAERFRLRDELRAEAVAAVTAGHASSWVEAGEIHQALWRALRRRLPAGCALRRRFVLAPVYRAIAGRPHLFGPGDLLTLRYVFCPELPDGPIQDRLAAASLVYNKLLSKEERVPAAGDFPHTRNEIDTIRFVRRLSLEECRRLFSDLRRARTRTAQRMVGGLSG
ncbi:MAG: hypothetical protein MUD16_14840 [Desulfobacterales bacterium]|jgi:hypothetical protein|nr:hypothetical protein [Desulfobacterales bacterium]